MSRLLGICGSLRKASFNGATLRAIAGLLPPESSIDIRYLHDLPMYDQDEIDADGIPAGVSSLRMQIAQADGVIIATPEYSHSVSGVLKNALDWTHGKPPHFAGKPVAIVSAASSPLGGSRAQYDLRKILQPLEAYVLPMPEMFVGGAGKKFDENGKLIDEATRTSLVAFLTAFETWMGRFRVTPSGVDGPPQSALAVANH